MELKKKIRTAAYIKRKGTPLLPTHLLWAQGMNSTGSSRSNSRREGCAGFRSQLGTIYARILGPEYPEQDLEGGGGGGGGVSSCGVS